MDETGSNQKTKGERLNEWTPSCSFCFFRELTFTPNEAFPERKPVKTILLVEGRLLGVHEFSVDATAISKYCGSFWRRQQKFRPKKDADRAQLIVPCSRLRRCASSSNTSSQCLLLLGGQNAFNLLEMIEVVLRTCGQSFRKHRAVWGILSLRCDGAVLTCLDSFSQS